MPPMRHISDPATLKAFAHPTRLRLMDALRASGPATVGMLSDRLDEAVGSISHHLSILERAGLVERAPELARDGRERWWRTVPGNTGWDRSQLDPASAAAGQAAEEVLLDHQTEVFRAAIHRAARPGHLDGFATNAWLRISEEELATLEREMSAVVDRFVALSRERGDAEGVEPVLFVARAARVEP